MECIKFEINKSIEIKELLNIWVSIETGKHGRERAGIKILLTGTGRDGNSFYGIGTGREYFFSNISPSNPDSVTVFRISTKKVYEYYTEYYNII